MPIKRPFWDRIKMKVTSKWFMLLGAKMFFKKRENGKCASASVCPIVPACWTIGCGGDGARFTCKIYERRQAHRGVVVHWGMSEYECVCVRVGGRHNEITLDVGEKQPRLITLLFCFDIHYCKYNAMLSKLPYNAVSYTISHYRMRILYDFWITIGNIMCGCGWGSIVWRKIDADDDGGDYD